VTGTSGKLVGIVRPPAPWFKLLWIAEGRFEIGMLAAFDGRLVAVASTSDTTEEGKSPVGIAV